MNGWLNVPTPSESVIQLLAHLGSGSLVQQVDTIDHQLDLSLKPSKGLLASGVVPKDISTSQINLLSGESSGSVTAVQVFVSSTFQDMYGERDLISGLVFPALRKKLSKLDHPVLLNEIDLRWGVPVEFSQTGESLRMCLEKVITSDYLILLIGERFVNTLLYVFAIEYVNLTVHRFSCCLSGMGGLRVRKWLRIFHRSFSIRC